MNVYPLKCSIRAQEQVTRVDVYDDIGGDWLFGGVSASDFASKLSGVTGALEVHINSGGGDVFDGIAIGNAIRAHKGPVTTVVDGIAASIASVIFQAGRKRVVADGSMLMIHDAWGACMGSAAEMTAMAATLEKVSDNLAGIYASRAGLTPGEWRDRMRTETWYTADEAIAAGLADQKGEHGAELPASLDVAAYAAVPGRIAAALRALPQARQHAAHSGEHSHSHPAYGAADADDDGEHSHPHSHDGDGNHGHDHQWDPDGDGDNDATPEGDTDHDYWAPDGTQLRSVPGKPMKSMITPDVRALVRHVANAAADDSAWDGPAAMAAALKAEDPAAAFRAICAGEHTAGSPDEEQHWALPHHKHAGNPPNRDGVRAALGRLGQTKDLKDPAAARAHLEAHEKAMGHASDHSHEDLAALLSGAKTLDALKEAFK